MNLDRFFKLVSYAAVVCGFFSLWITGTFGPVESFVFVLVVAAGWLLEGSRWQIPERLGTALIVLALPASYAAYRLGLLSFGNSETVIAGLLARMILALSGIKILQKKSDRDWIFLYLMSFFEILLAAGLSISLMYLGSFVLYFLVMACTVVAFEMRKTRNDVHKRLGREGQALDADGRTIKIRQLPTAAFVLIFFIVLVAAPLFFLLPRVGGAGLGSLANSLSTSTGFSDTVKLGGIGRLQQNDAVVMRVKLEDRSSGDGLYFRGTALDTFDNLAWTRSGPSQKEPFVANNRDLIQLDFATGRQRLLIQTIYLEPLDTPILFAVPRAIAVQGNFPVLYKDRFGAISFQPANDRTSYKVFSDPSLPSREILRGDNQAYSAETAAYLQMPQQFDQRITDLASQVTARNRNRYDKAASVENYLKTTYGYTLEMKAGGPEPVADFLFNVKEGHCEYFASAMALMLRTQGIATRIVNGFRGGEFNDTADMYVVRQRHAHAWVEVYFPKENVWVPFDPTPASSEPDGAAGGLIAKAGKYLEALDALWIQYFVAFDNQGQRSLARAARDGFSNYRIKTAAFAALVQAAFAEWMAELRGENGIRSSMFAIGTGFAYLAALIVPLVLLGWLYRRVIRLGGWKRIGAYFDGQKPTSPIQYYDRLLTILSAKGYERSADVTPLEFASAIGQPPALLITQKYNAVRFGNRSFSQEDVDDIENWLTAIENDLDPADKK